ncbi:hypothetical protein ColTof4_04262 [Colletotrichum tofieldiae]|nr:hypothetical protein ColTof3_14108 [Colletotrichum tofieldiae]GKT71839.1 hypothetical protein ColTof4_04262 [Colletotrichum tofieldiae]GKT94981.1 hypothetical protein Ct61P_12831 [Colletotrichum tofieldiae]
MDSSNSYGGSSSKGTSPDDKSKAYDQSAIFDGLLPRIESRGQSKHSSKKSSGKKKESKSSSQQPQALTNLIIAERLLAFRTSLVLQSKLRQYMVQLCLAVQYELYKVNSRASE